MFQFEELDDLTRSFMLQEFEQDLAAGALYVSDRLTSAGKTAYPNLLRDAIRAGSDDTLTRSLQNAGYCVSQEQRVRQGKHYWAKLPANASQVLAEGEFNVFYMRGLMRRLLKEGDTQAEVCRAKAVHDARTGELVNPGDIVQCQDVLNDLRTRDQGAGKVGIPRGPASGICLRRVRK